MCELGAGLGLVAVLIEKLGYTEGGGLLVATDGDEPTMALLIDNKVDNECFFDSSYLYWGENEDFLSTYPDKFEVVIAADVIYEEEQIEPLLDSVCAVMRSKSHPCHTLLYCNHFACVLSALLHTIKFSVFASSVPFDVAKHIAYSYEYRGWLFYFGLRASERED